MRIRPLCVIALVAAAGCGTQPAQITQQVPILSAGSGASFAPVLTAGVGATKPLAMAGQPAPTQTAAPSAGVGAGSSAAGSPAVAGSGGAAAAGSGSAGSGYVPSGLPDVQFALDVMIPAGKELLECQYVAMPSDRGVIAVNSAESHYTPGSHHFLVYRTNLTSYPAGQDASHLCGSPGVTVAKNGGGNGLTSVESSTGQTGSYYEAQTPNTRRDLPPGIAHVFAPGEILMMTAHYLNTTDAAIDSMIEFRLHPMDVKDVKVEAGTFFLIDTQLNIPPHSEVTFTKSCPMTKDITLGILWSHMHGRGYSFRAWTDDAAATAQLGGDVYVQPGPNAWEEPHIQNYPVDPPVILHAGSKLMISCTYQNTTDRTFTFGLSAETAEMCLLHGMYWPRLDGATERCSNGTSMSGKSMSLAGM
jgi:hypothetical protein